MLLETFADTFEYKKLSKEEQEQRGILGRLVGVIADSINPTRNGRKYNAELWDKVFQNPIMKEKIANKVCFGEICHPIDGREDVDPEKVAICLAEVPKKNTKGQLVGVFDILNTPCGKILKTMLDYGTTIGVSSRGSGDIETDWEGNESVNPDTYDCIGWDIVFVPAVKEARLQLVTESLEKKRYNKSLRESLEKTLNEASEEDRRIMQETLEEIGVNLSETIPEELNDNENQPEKEDIDKAENQSIDTAVVNNEAQIIERLQQLVKENQDLANTQISIKEQLSASHTREKEQEFEIARYKKTIIKLAKNTSKLEALNQKVLALTEQLNAANKQCSVLSEQLSDYELNAKDKEQKLTESISNKIDALSQLQEKYDKLTTQYNQITADYSSYNKTEISKLTEQLEITKKDFALSESQFKKKEENYKELIEKYRKIASDAVGHFIEEKALVLGCSKNEILNKLPNNYTFKDIESVCEDLKAYKVNLNKLPIFTEGISKISASYGSNAMLSAQYAESASIDDDLLRLAGLK